jgi:tetratricopeptide (TPR) repeat protein
MYRWLYRFKRGVGRASFMVLALTLAACSAPYVRDTSSSPAVSVPEPGTQRPGAHGAPVTAPSGAQPHAAPDAGRLQPGAAAAMPGEPGAQPDYRPASSNNNAVNILLAQADDARRRGDLDTAIAAAERALRIAPADPAVYYQLAVLRLQRGDLALADQLARKGLSYQPDPGLRMRLQEIIERARHGITG